jgi:cell fate regulator YaaT (PSP1 superfamily)
MPQVYLVRYGLMGHVGRFASQAEGLTRGQTVVLRTDRGVELGEILATPRGADGLPAAEARGLIRAAGPEDLERARCAERERPRLLAACDRVFGEGAWPLEPIDVESLPDLDGQSGRVVIHYLGPHHLDTEGLAAAFQETQGLKVSFEPVGRDAEDEPAPAHDLDEGGCGSCGAGGCGSEGGGCGTGHGGSCSSCGVKDLVARRSRTMAHA